MKLAKVIIILVVPGAIPIWLGHELYKKIKKPKTEESEDE